MTTFLLQTARAMALLLVLSIPAHAALNLSDPIPVGPQVRLGKLPNGLTYYIHKNGMPEKRVELRLVVRVGSVMEDEDQQGLAHFTEHMAFNGSSHFKKHELISYLQSIGIKFGADLNAYTSFDETVYILPIPTDKKENLETGFQVLEDWAHGVQMNEADIDKERDIVLEEARLRKGADDRMNKVLWPEIFSGSRYAERLPIGKESILKNFPYEALKRFYADWYRPDLMAVVVVGDIEPGQAEQMIKAHFTHLKNPEHERIRNETRIPARTDTKGLIITDREATGNALLIRYPVRDGKPNLTIADYRQSLVKGLCDSMLAQRLQDLTQEARPPFLGASGAMGIVSPGYEAYTSTVTLGHEGIAPALAALLQENKRARQFGFSATELERAKKNSLRNVERQYSERDKSNSANYAAEYIRNFLLQEEIPGIANQYAYDVQLLPEISLDEINQYARQNIPGAGPKLMVYMGSSQNDMALPSDAQLLALADEAERAPVAVRNEKILAGSLMPQPPKPGSIVSEKQNKELGTTELTLSNGLSVLLKPTDFKNDEVLMSASRFGGLFVFSEPDKYSALYANGVAWGMGLGQFTPSEIRKILAGKAVHLRTNSDLYTEDISGSAGSADLETLLQLLYLRLTTLRKDETLFQSYVGKGRDASKNALASPAAVFGESVRTTLYNDHPRLIHTAKPDDFSKINLERSMEIFGERFGSARDMRFVIVGSFDIAAIKPLIATYLASLPTGEIATSYRDLGLRPVGGVVKKEMRSGHEPKSQVTLVFTGPASFSPEEHLRFHAMLEVMNLRVTDVLREKLTLIYSGGMNGAIERIPYGNYHINVGLPCGPENVDKVIAALLAEVEKIKQEGPQAADLDKVKQNWHKGHQMQLRSNGYWRDYLQDDLLYGTDPATILSVDQRTDAITAADIQAAARRYFNLENYLQAVLYPEK